jgi:methanogenic corrinoid protein MtbC1
MVEKAMSASQSIVLPDLRLDPGPCWSPGETGGCDPAPGAARRSLVLARTIECDVIPRLILAHRAAPAPAYVDRAPSATPTADDVATLTALSLEGDIADVEAFVAGIEATGVALERIYLDLLAPVARRLGEMWEADECDFSTVTMGLCALQHVVLNSGRHFTPAQQRPRQGRRAVLAPLPGETHTFGLVIVAEFFRRAGWDVWSGTGVTSQEIVAKVRAESFAIAAFSLASEDHLAALAGLIHRVRRASLNQRIGILVGGAIFTERPGLVADVGADATAADGDEATLQAETLLAINELRA